MKPPLPRTLSAAPQTLHVQLEIAKAIRTLAGPGEDELLRQRRAEIAAIRHDLEALSRDIRKAGEEWLVLAKAELRAALKKYSPDQARVPAGSPDGGEWTKEDGGAANVRLADASEYLTSSQQGQVITDAGPTIQVAQAPGRPGYPIDLTEDEAPRGIGHTIRDHVGKSEGYLLTGVREAAAHAKEQGDIFEGLKEGSFPSLEAANKLVSAAISQNQTKVDLVINDQTPGQQFDAWFPSPTGYEAYAKNERSQPYIRATYGVHVVIVRDRASTKGYQVYTAFPINP
jgi:hypothetical protein